MLDFSELLPRRSAEVNFEAMRRFVEGRRVLITGAGGSIGSELCRQIFIRTSEAVQLVIQAAAMGGSGAMYVLEMGASIRIVDLAHRMLEACGAPAGVPIEFIGLRPGEKLDEELAGIDEATRPTKLPHIGEIRSETPVPATFAEDLARLEALAYVGTAEEVIAQLRAIVPELTAAAAVQAQP